MDKKRQRYLEALRRIEAPLYPFDHILIGICNTQLGSYAQAQQSYSLAVREFLDARQMWQMAGCPHWPVEAFMMSGQPRFYERVYQEVSAYKLDRRRDALIALYAFALVELVAGNDSIVLDYVPGLLEYPKHRGIVAIGDTISAIVQHEQTEFDEALTLVLEEHRNKAKHGELRGTPEGFMSLPGMCLARIALMRGLSVEVENEYLSLGYLEYLSSAIAS